MHRLTALSIFVCLVVPGTARAAHSPVPAAERDLAMESQPFLQEALYDRLEPLPRGSSGAYGINREWERGDRPYWKVSVQRTAEHYVIGGIVSRDTEMVEDGLLMLDWAFRRQGRTGGFPGRRNNFHGTTYFLQAAAHSALALRASPYARRYVRELRTLERRLLRTARWVISARRFRVSTRANAPYTHRSYLVATALGLSSLVTSDRALKRDLRERARSLIRRGAARQRSDGANPERDAVSGRDGHDSGYHATGLLFASRWVMYFPRDRETSRVRRMLKRGFAWQRSRIRPSGRIDTNGNTRTCGNEFNDTGERKDPHYSTVERAFAYRHFQVRRGGWLELARRVLSYAQSGRERC